VAAALNRRKPLCWGTGIELGGELLAAIMSPDADRKGSAVPEVWPYVECPSPKIRPTCPVAVLLKRDELPAERVLRASRRQRQNRSRVGSKVLGCLLEVSENQVFSY
jgi:hypothetical protein